MDPVSIADNSRLPRVNRVEVIDKSGRVYTNMDTSNVWLSFQDGGCTLKVFLDHEPPYGGDQP